MRKSIIVFGGSFNPPTLAHIELLTTSVSFLRAEKGLFVPSSDKYVSRKMHKDKSYNQVYSEEQRLEMLKRLCEKDIRLGVNTCEYGDDGKGHTYNTLKKIQESYPDHEIIFLVGEDKLSIMSKWHNHEALFEEFSFGVITRNEMGRKWYTLPDFQISQNDELSKYKEKFYTIPINTTQIMKLAFISSTFARRALVRHEYGDLYHLLDKTTIQYFKEIGEIPDEQAV